MANEYGRWFVRNDPQSWRRKLGAYKRPFSERYQRPSEYTPSVEEYRHYPAMKNIVAEQEEKKKEELRQDDASKRSENAKRQSRTARNAGRNVGNIVKNIVGKAVAVVGGGVVIVSSYQAMTAAAAKSVEEPPVAEIVADWEGWDKSDSTVMFTLKDAEGNVIKEISAEITSAEVPATCTATGSITYTAIATDDGKEYSDSYTEIVAALGHKFDAGKVETDENGNSVIVYECSECHEEFEFSAHTDEND